jgi:glyoxylase-like metal-dependent hydrolase (beta-lactamase superfamily II)
MVEPGPAQVAPRLGDDVFRLDDNVFRFDDTCNVYAIRSGREAVLIDFGSGDVLDRLDAIGVDRVTDVLLTHHHRDQAQGLARATAAGIRVWVPPVEQELVAGADRHWLARQVANDYDLRQDRFSLLEQVEIAGTVAEYRTRGYGAVELYALPTPGHTVGSVSYLFGDLAFTGDLVYGNGQLWSVAATQWTYTGSEGPLATYLSAGVVARRGPRLLLPSHGAPIEDPAGSLELLRARVRELAELRLEQPYDLDAWESAPWVEVTPHLLRNRTSFATSYALLSETGAALLLDWGYDQATGVDMPTDRAGRRPLLTSLDRLDARVEAVAITHYHDDHVAGVDLLRDVLGAEVWAPANVAPVLERPERLDLPCLWFDPVRVDRVLPLGEPFRWHEYELTVHPLPGHTRYQAAYAFEVDGRRVLATGDQQALGPDGRPILNYQYRNGFRPDDYVATAELYAALRPQLLVTGHWGAHEVDDAFVGRIARDGARLAALHRELLPLDEIDLGPGGFAARIEPYRATVPTGGSLELDVVVRNPFARDETAAVGLVVPAGWTVEPRGAELELGPGAEATARFRLTAGAPSPRARIGADLTVGSTRLGQQAEALVEVR